MADTPRTRAARRVQGERWPSLMTRATAAAYLDGTEASLEKEYLSGNMPGPVIYAGKEMWRKADIDAAIEKIGGQHVPNWRDTAPLYHPELVKPPRKKRGYGFD